MLGRLVLFMLADCEVGAMSAPAEPTTPRLAAVGTESYTTFDTDGHPVFAKARFMQFRYQWNGDQLRSVFAQLDAYQSVTTINAEPIYRDGLLVDFVVDGGRHDTLEYNDAGALIRWAQIRPQLPDYVRSYSYDDRGRLVRVEMPSVFPDKELAADELSYAATDCPWQIAGETRFNELVVIDGRLTGFSYGLDEPAAPIRYNGDGYIAHFDSPEVTLRDLHYEPSPVRGLDQWPGHINAGFPIHGELFRLDGSCDPTLTSQAAIAAMVIPELLR